MRYPYRCRTWIAGGAKDQAMAVSHAHDGSGSERPVSTGARLSTDRIASRDRTAAIVPSVLCFSTDQWPKRDRLEALREVYGRSIVKFDVEPVSDAPLHLEAKFIALPGLGLALASGAPSRIRRTPQHVVNDDLILNIRLAGGGTFFQRSRETTIGEGDAILTTGAEVSGSVISQSRFISLRIPHKAMVPLVPDLDDHIARPIRRGSPALALLTGYIGILQNAPTLPTAELCRSAVTHVYDLLALALGATREAGETAKSRGARVARLHAIKADIADNLARDDLSVATVAARHRLPVRYVQRLFEAEGVTFTDFVLEARLLRAYRMLIDPRRANLKISAVAYEAGFGDPSYFNRTFRSRYFASPSDVRAQALGLH